MYVTPEFALRKENIEQENVGLCFAPKEDSERAPREQKGASRAGLGSSHAPFKPGQVWARREQALGSSHAPCKPGECNHTQKLSRCRGQQHFSKTMLLLDVKVFLFLCTR